MFETLLVADRGDIAVRVIRTARRLGVRTVAVYSEPDRRLPHVAEADDAVLLGEDAGSYRDADKLLEAAAQTSAQAVHPGRGARSADPGFARAVVGAGMAWVGPPGDAMEAMFDKVAVQQRLAAAGVSVLDHDLDLAKPRHVQVPILGLPDGTVVALPECESSTLRPAEEVEVQTPAPGVGAGLRARLQQAATRAGEVVGHRNAGTVGCVVDIEAQDLFFVEVHPGLHAGHAATELATGIDLVEQQLLVAAGEPPSFDVERISSGFGRQA